MKYVTASDGLPLIRGESPGKRVRFSGYYRGAKITAGVFKVLAVLWLVAGLVVLTHINTYYSTMQGSAEHLAQSIDVAAMVLGTVMLLFLAYVLDLLRGIWEETAGENE